MRAVRIPIRLTRRCAQIRLVVDYVIQAMKSQGMLITVVHQLMHMRGQHRLLKLNRLA